jgi:hypothetical protein
MPDGKAPTIANTQYPPIDDTHYTVYVQPGLNQWQHNSWDPQRGNFFLQVSSSVTIRISKPASEVAQGLAYVSGVGAFNGYNNAATVGTPAATLNKMRLVAYNPAKNKISWVTEYEANANTPNYLGAFTGIVTTKSGVLFVGRANGYLEAYDSADGKLLWTSPKLLAATTSAPMIFSVNGKETVGFYTGYATNVPGKTGSGSELYAFQLP